MTDISPSSIYADNAPMYTTIPGGFEVTSGKTRNKWSFPSAKMTFFHPAIGYLDTDYGVNSVSWNYGMNIQRYPTYGGEVIQILSVYVDDITLQGQIATYRQMELLFAYFAAYMEVATQGLPTDTPMDQIAQNPAYTITETIDQYGSSSGQGGSLNTQYNEYPMQLSYPERGWNFYIQPKDMVGFRYGREQVAPQWEITAAVFDVNPATLEDIKQAIATSMVQPTSEFGGNTTASPLDNSFDIVGQIGFNPNNPFSNPFPQEGIVGNYDPSLTKPFLQDFGNYYNQIVQNYAGSNFTDLMNQFGSGPMPSSPPSGQKSGG